MIAFFESLDQLETIADRRAIEINGNSYQLYQVYGEKPYGDYINWDYAELPWYKILPESGKASSMYVLEEWVTVHKPDN